MKEKFLNTIAIFSSFIFFLFLFNISAFSQVSATKLTLNNPLNSQIKGGENHFYSIDLSANQTAHVEVIQKGVETSLSAYNPKGTRFAHSWALSGLFGKETILVTAKETGVYKVEVEPYLPNALLGKYTIILKEIRPSVAKDFEINKANILITRTISQAERLRGSSKREHKLKSIEKWDELIRLSKITGEKVWEAAALAITGVIYYDLGELQKALDAYLNSLKIWQQLGNRQNQGSLIHNLGSIYQQLGDFKKAKSFYEQGIKLHRETKNIAGVASTLNSLATNYSQIGNYKKAIQLYRESIALDEKYKQWDYKERLSTTLNNLAMALIKNNQQKEGVTLFIKALEMRREIKDYSGVAHSLLFMGKYLSTSKDYKELAYTKLIEAKNLARNIGDLSLQSQALYRLAVIEQQKGSAKNLDKAIEYINEAVSLIEHMRRKIVDEKSRYSYFATVQDYYELYIDLVISHYEKTKDKQDIEIALKLSESARSRSLLDLLKEAKVDLRKGNNPKLLEILKNLQRDLNNKYAIRQQILSNKGDAKQIAEINNKINAVNINIQTVKFRIRRENPKYVDLTEGKVVRAKEIQSLLDDKSVLLEYKLGKKRSFVWLVTNDSIEVFTLPRRREIEIKAKTFYDLVVANKRSQESKKLRTSKELSEILFSQFAEKLSGKRLVIVADGILQYIPFSALKKPTSKAQLLIDTNEIVMLSSASVLAQIRRTPQKGKENSKTIAIYADPVFDPEDARIPQKFSSKDSLVKNISIKQSLRDFQWGETLPRLLASRREAKNISSLIGAETEDVKMDFAANLKSFETADLSKYRIIHFATHGLLNASRPEFSGLVFSLYGKNGQEQEGFLSLNEIYNLKLSSDMVVLSACQTAFGKNVKGEGLIGLSRGFLYAGSNRVVASLWKVDDFATAEFMKRFYQNHLEKEMPASKALQQTKIEMKKIPRYKSPFYWSAFTLLGDWK